MFEEFEPTKKNKFGMLQFAKKYTFFTVALLIILSIICVKIFQKYDTMRNDAETKIINLPHTHLNRKLLFDTIDSIKITKRTGKIDKNKLLKDFYKQVKSNKLFDSKGLPVHLDYNLLDTFDKNLNQFTQQEIRDIFDYRMTLLETQNYSQSYDFLTDYFIHNNLHRLYDKLDHELPEEAGELPEYCNNRVDVLWLYVNGTEEHWMETYNQFTKKHVDAKRYREYGSLQYSMRSVYESLQYENIHWHLVVQDEYQIPTFLDKSKLIYYNDESTPGSLRIIYHKDFFPNASYLPVFNSNAIESALYNIKGLGECMLYMNDDFFINVPLTPSMVFTNDGKLKIYQQIRTGATSFSLYPWSNMIASTNKALDRHFQNERKRHYIGHFCYFFRMSILRELGVHFHEELDYTQKQRLRSYNDTVLVYLHGNYALEKGYAEGVFEFGELSYYTRIYKYSVVNAINLNIINKKTVPFLCVNDALVGSVKEQERAIYQYQKMFRELYTVKTPFEMNDETEVKNGAEKTLS